ncbi:nonstructural protein [Tortoise microvirus 50]|nr:nonstructural protein [Tortoise microvirus 50]
MKVFSIYDKKACTFSPSFTCSHAAEAARSFADLCNDPKTTIFKFSSDFALYELAEFDQSTGSFACIQPPKLLHDANEFKRSEENV